MPENIRGLLEDIQRTYDNLCDDYEEVSNAASTLEDQLNEALDELEHLKNSPELEDRRELELLRTKNEKLEQTILELTRQLEDKIDV